MRLFCLLNRLPQVLPQSARRYRARLSPKGTNHAKQKKTAVETHAPAAESISQSATSTDTDASLPLSQNDQTTAEDFAGVLWGGEGDGARAGCEHEDRLVGRFDAVFTLAK